VARINDLLRQLERTDAGLAAEIQREYEAVADRRAFGLNFERHTPEAVELPGRPVRRGDKVHVLPPRGETPKKENHEMWIVESIDKSGHAPVATIVRESGNEDLESQDVPLEDLVVVAEFRDPIYPGLVSTGKVERGGDKPYHSVINGENFHALEALLFTHRGKVDAIYIDPPYNTGARDWKYNNDYVESDDLYRHSKWLAFMERRLKLAKELLRPDDSVMVVTIDENEYATLTLLITQLFPAHDLTGVPIVHNPRGVQGNSFSYTHEFAIFVTPRGKSLIAPRQLSVDEKKANTSNLRNWGGDSERHNAKNCFYPVFVRDYKVVGFGEVPADSFHPPANEISGEFEHVAVWPIDEKGVERKWRYARQSVEAIQEQLVVTNARNGDLAIHLAKEQGKFKTVWQDSRHDASTFGSQLVKSLTGDRNFPFPKSIYAVFDCLYAAAFLRPDALILDFFSGSGTTAHATMMLNALDGGLRTCISVTNNEVSAEEQKELRKKKFRQGDPEWEKWGICDYITKPRIAAAITGTTPDGNPIKGDYKFTHEFPMANGFEENVEFFTLTYESSLQVTAGRTFERISPLLWLQAGSRGKRIESLPEGWAVAETYGVLIDLAKADAFVEAIVANSNVTHAFLMTDEDRLFETVAQQLPAHVEAVRMYEAYLRNFERDALRTTR
jgi:adenine-specific DNA-methyltransferase